ncbi:hypothetical protein, partial [uncultured Muribaculum sp.]|uniref:hypothetical protein n=1 Tax=uncultured Muribaculum sp. TaxID=1918613 RepID=UPI00266EFC76
PLPFLLNTLNVRVGVPSPVKVYPIFNVSVENTGCADGEVVTLSSIHEGQTITANRHIIVKMNIFMKITFNYLTPF